jgi:hypothetical protein
MGLVSWLVGWWERSSGTCAYSKRISRLSLVRQHFMPSKTLPKLLRLSCHADVRFTTWQAIALTVNRLHMPRHEPSAMRKGNSSLPSPRVHLAFLLFLFWQIENFDSWNNHSKCTQRSLSENSFVFRYDMAIALPKIHTDLCISRSNGAVTCVPPYNHVVVCSADLTRWPYDTHTCTMTIGSWTHIGEEMNISLLKPGVRTQLKQFCVRAQNPV